MKKRLLSMLALLCIAVTSAWADPNILPPTINGDREFTESVEVTMTCTSANADIYYTVNGKDPLTLPDNQQIEYKNPITLTETTTIMARAFDGNDWSAMVEVTFTKKAVPTYALTKADGAEAHGTIAFKVGENAVTSAAEGDVVTVVVTPATGYVVNEVSGQWYAAVAAAPQRRTGIDLLDKVTLTPVEGQTNQWTFTMQRANVEISSTYKKLLTNTDITVADISALTYSGVAQTPTVTVKDGETPLVLNTDYTVSYSNNVNVGTATVTITAVSTSQKYAGETTKTFTIQKKALTITADDKTVTYGDAAPKYTVSYDGFVNNETADVLGGTLKFASSYVQNTSGIGEYTVTPSGLTSDNYAITFTAGTLTVGAKVLTADMIADIADLTYTGKALTPAPVVTFNGMTLVEDRDYVVGYRSNVNAGTATIILLGTGNYDANAYKSFTIKKAKLTVTADDKTASFGDAAPEYTVSYKGFVNNETADVLGGTLSFACPYVQNQSGSGEYTITPSGLTSDNYEITFTAGTLTVGKKALTADMIADIADLTYTGQPLTPAVTVKDGETTLVKDTDYTVSYADNTNAGTATVTVTGKGNYSGTKTAQFTIAQAELTAFELAATKFVYNKQEQTAQVSSVKAGQLDVPADGYEVSGNKATNVGTYTVTVTGKGNFKGQLTAQYSIVADKAELDKTLTDANAYYESIKNDYADIAAPLQEALNAAKDIQADEAATQQAVDDAVTALKAALQTAKDAVNSILTSIESVQIMSNGQWYDLNGRKLEGNPTKKGIYIRDGRKILVK